MGKQKELILNFLSLSSVQAANYLLPLITIPYLVRVLGPAEFGLISFAQAFVSYFILFTDYGFNLSATRQISIHRNKIEKICNIFNSVIFIKVGFMFLSLAVLSLLVFSLRKFRADWLVYFFTFGLVAGNVLFPVWLFQGMEKMKYIASLNFVSRFIFTVSIFIFIKSQKDYLYVPLISSLGSLFVALLSLVIVVKKFRIPLKIPSRSEVSRELKEGWHIFISTVAVSLYTTSNAFILGLFTTTTIVGYYSAGEKIIRACQGLFNPVSQTVYPHISQLASQSKEAALRFIRKIIKIFGVPAFLISLALLLFAPTVSRIVLGKNFSQSIPVIQILSFLPFIIYLSNIFGIQTMLTFGLKEVFTKILIRGSMLNILVAFLVVMPFKHIGISFSTLVTEIYVTAAMYFALKQKGFHVFRLNEPKKANET